MANLFDTKLIDLMPENYRMIDEIKWLCASVQPQIDEVLEIIRDKIIFTKLDKLDDLTLDYLLDECGISGSIEISFIKTREDKIKFISNYVTLNKLRGTRDGIEYALSMIGIEADIIEWFESADEVMEPYWFKLIINDVIDNDKRKLLNSYIKQYKNTRSWYQTKNRLKLESSIYATLVPKFTIKIRSTARCVPSLQSSIYAVLPRRTKMILRGHADGRI